MPTLRFLPPAKVGKFRQEFQPAAPRIPPSPHLRIDPFMAAWPRGLCSDVACRVALQNTPARFAKTIRHASKRRSVPRRYVFEKWNCIIKKSLPERKGKGPLKRLNPDENFTEVSLLEYGDLKPILLFLGGRSDAACCVVIPLYAVPH